MNDRDFIDLCDWSWSERFNNKGLKLLQLVKKYYDKKSNVHYKRLKELEFDVLMEQCMTYGGSLTIKF